MKKIHTDDQPNKQLVSSWRNRLHEIIFEAETPAGKTFDVLLIICIITSIIVVMVDSVSRWHQSIGQLLLIAEWAFTILFTIEYLLRLVCIGRPIKYATSFFGIVDLLAIIPTYLGLFLPGTKFLLAIRVLRILRVFRVLKLVQYLDEADYLLAALRSSGRKIAVFLFAVGAIVVICGSLMYVIEGEANGFTSIPRSIYWAIVTLTTVGYGDISPQTDLGQVLASIIMILGYGIIAVPTGIVTVGLTQASSRTVISTTSCPECSSEGHTPDALFCKDCGSKL
ncbi:MAG: ion transporter [Desulfobacteraceae bacterium 4572_35.2]|nr:MAG: ion transporter [Desulfobacteraceae bacterium 4572_35.2]